MGMTEKNELLPCPFCGGEANIQKTWVPRSKERVACCADQECLGHQEEQDEQGGWAVSFQTDAEAIAAWNRRHSPVVGEGAVAWRGRMTPGGEWAFRDYEMNTGDLWCEVQPLYAAPSTIQTGDDGVREAVARLIEPTAWMAKDVNPDWDVISLTRKLSAPLAVAQSLKKADAILAALASPPVQKEKTDDPD